MTKLQGFSMRETGRSMRMSEGAVKVAVHRAIQRLRRLVGGKP